MEKESSGTIVTKTGEFFFSYKSGFNSDFKAIVHDFKIWKDSHDPDDFKNYSLMIKELQNGTDLKVIDMFANRYKGKGISIPMLLKVKEIFNKRVVSSSNKKKSCVREMNWEDAIYRVWHPMVDQGLAMYNEENDYYYLL